MREEARDERPECGQTGADDASVAFHGGPGGGSDVVIYSDISVFGSRMIFLHGKIAERPYRLDPSNGK